MHPPTETRELAILLRISRELDIVGDVSATLDNPSELLAWATTLRDATIAAWRGHDSGHRYLQVTAHHHRAPVHGRVAAVLPCDRHHGFWRALHPEELAPGETRPLTLADLSAAWSAQPLTPPVPEDADADAVSTSERRTSAGDPGGSGDLAERAPGGSSS